MTDVKRALPITAIQHLTTEKKKQTQKTPKSEKTTKQLLGEFYSDKKYLENLLKDEGTVLLLKFSFASFFYSHLTVLLFLYIFYSPIRISTLQLQMLSHY